MTMQRSDTGQFPALPLLRAAAYDVRKFCNNHALLTAGAQAQGMQCSAARAALLCLGIWRIQSAHGSYVKTVP